MGGRVRERVSLGRRGMAFGLDWLAFVGLHITFLENGESVIYVSRISASYFA